MIKQLLTTIRPRGGMLFAVVALVLALGGTATAAKLITGKQIKNSSLTGADVKGSSLTGSDIRNGSIGPADLSAAAKGAKGDPGAPGAPGAPGPKGDTGANGTNGTNGRTKVLFSRNTSGEVAENPEEILLGRSIGDGAHLVQVSLRAQSDGVADRIGQCRLLDAFQPGTDLDRRVVNFYETLELGEITMQGVFPKGGFPQVKCRGEDGLAVKFGRATMAVTAVDELVVDGE